MGALEDNVVIGAAGEECLKAPSEAIDVADLCEVMHGLHLFGDGAANSRSEHGLQVHVEAGLGRIEGFFERGFNDRKEGFNELGVVGLAFYFFEAGKGFLEVGNWWRD